jgi:hypothetical protein
MSVANPITITNLDVGSVVLEHGESGDGLLRNADAADPATFAAGTILARHSTSLKFEPYDPAGSDGLNAPKAVLTYEVGPVAAVTDVAVRVLIAGKVNQRRLKIHDATPITAAHLDALRDCGIVPVDVAQLGKLDNPA